MARSATPLMSTEMTSGTWTPGRCESRTASAQMIVIVPNTTVFPLLRPATEPHDDGSHDEPRCPANLDESHRQPIQRFSSRRHRATTRLNSRVGYLAPGPSSTIRHPILCRASSRVTLADRRLSRGAGFRRSRLPIYVSGGNLRPSVAGICVVPRYGRSRN